MALIKCPECGKEISDKAPTCTHCGFPIERPMVGIPTTILFTISPIWGIILFAYITGGLSFSNIIGGVAVGVILGILYIIDESAIKKAGYSMDKVTSELFILVPVYLYRRMKIIGKNKWLCPILWFVCLAIMLFWIFFL